MSQFLLEESLQIQDSRTLLSNTAETQWLPRVHTTEKTNEIEWNKIEYNKISLKKIFVRMLASCVILS